MTPDPQLLQRLRFLARVVRRQSEHLATTDGRLFRKPFDSHRARRLGKDVDEAERVEAFVGRFSRLQDTLGDKLLPSYLEAVGERPGALVDNLDRSERLALIASAEDWFAVRKLRNQMIHEYIEDPTILANALQTGHQFVPVLRETTDTMLSAMEERGWLG